MHTFVCECCYLQLKIWSKSCICLMKGRRPNATCPWTKHKASKCKVMPEEWGVSKLAPAQVEGRGGALFQECLAQKVIPGVKIYENFIKHLFVPWYSPDSREKKKKRGQAFWKTKGAWSMDFSFWETHLKIHLKSQRYTHSFTSNTLQFCFLIGLSVGKRGWHAFHIDIIQHI